MSGPKTKDEALAYRYGAWAGCPGGRAYCVTNCAEEIHRDYLFHQCSRKNGHGPEGIFCKQHAKQYGNLCFG